MELSKGIHTTIPREVLDWIKGEAERDKCTMSAVISKSCRFYQRNKEVPQQLICAKTFIKKLVEEEIRKQHASDNTKDFA